LRNEKLKRLLEVAGSIKSIEIVSMRKCIEGEERERLLKLNSEYVSLMKEIESIPYVSGELLVSEIKCFKTVDGLSSITGSTFVERGGTTDWKVQYENGIPVYLFKFVQDGELHNRPLKVIRSIKVLTESELQERKEADRQARLNRPKKEPTKWPANWLCLGCSTLNYEAVTKCLKCGRPRENLGAESAKGDKTKAVFSNVNVKLHKKSIERRANEETARPKLNLDKTDPIEKVDPATKRGRIGAGIRRFLK
jgi:hypothetical protein